MDPNLTTQTLGFKHILLMKLSFAVLSSIVTQFIILLFYIFIVNFHVLRPLESVVTFFNTITSLSTWLSIIPFASIIFLQSIICAKDYIIQTKYSSTRFQKLLAVFSYHNVLLIGLHALVGSMCVWLFMSLGVSNYSGLVNKCGDNYCCDENALYYLFFGAYTGIIYFALQYTSDKKILFPVVQQKKWLQFKVNLFPILKSSKVSAFWPTFNYILFYAIFGNYFASKFSFIFGFELQEKNSGLFTYLLSWIFSTLIYFYLNLMTFFYELFLTEPIQFPIVAITEDCFTLNNAINANIPIIKHLASLDLFILSGKSKSRREVLFTLSQPGGHPHNWNHLIEASLKILKDYTETLNKSLNTILLTEKTKVQPVIEPLSPAPKANYNKLRNMSLHSENYGLVNVNTGLNVSCVSRTEETTSNAAMEKLNTYISTLKEKLGINFLFRELPEASIQKCLGDGQVIMWITQAISSLSVASLREDRYGIVQKDLPIIITTLVELKLSVEKLNRIPALNRRGPGLDDFNSKMKLGVLNAVKRSLYGICHCFGPYLKDLNLKKEVVSQLQGFVQMKLDYY